MLKAAQKELQAGNIDAALVSVENYLDDNPENYNALLIQGKCYQESNPSRALDIFRRATEIDPNKTWAWKGKITCCVALRNCTKLLASTMGLVLAMESQDAAKNRPLALDQFQKTMKFVERNGDAAEKRRLLKAQLPGSAIYEYLGPVLAPPMVTLNQILNEERQQLKTALSKLKGRARNNLSFNTNKMEKEQLKLFSGSEIPQLLEELINIAPEDEVRRMAEVELLEFNYQLLNLSPKKSELAAKVHEMADDMVLFAPPSPLPYLVHWDWMDCESYRQLDESLIRLFIDLFPEHGLARILDAFLHSPINPFSALEQKSGTESDTDDNETTKVWTHQEIMDAINVGYEEASMCIIANRIIADFLLLSDDYENGSQFAKEGLRLVSALHQNTSVWLPVTKLQFSLQLGTAYIYYQAPKNFPLAQKLFDEVLKTTPNNEQALIGNALLLVQSHEVDKALAAFDDLVKRFPDNYTALSELAWCNIRVGRYTEAQDSIHRCLKLALDQGSTQQIADRRALLYWRLGYSFWIENNLEEAFANFVNALQQNPSYAPAFSYLGLFYQKQGDTSRATRCFYKALEINAGEIIAAHCLVSNFANESQWDIVEIITARLLESEKLVDPITGQQVEWPFRVMGIACIDRGDYPEAVKYFQKCLRLTPNDTNSWVGLGEAYIHSGRYQSAVKALQRALEIEPENLSALYDLSLAYRETLDFSAAAKAIEEALRQSPIPEFRAALVDNFVKAAQSYLSSSLLGDAMDTAVKGLHNALADLKLDNTHGSMWASVASCVEIFLQIKGHADMVPSTLVAELADLAAFAEPTDYNGLLIACLEKAQQFVGASRGSRAAAAFNLGLGYYKTYSLFGGTEADLHKAIEHLKRAITFETRNFEYWNVYGVIVQRVNARIAQHCFVRSLNLFIRSPATWANLGLLYLDSGDLELASEAFDRALSIDPDTTTPWVGQALSDYILGKSTEQVLRLFEHSYLISSGQDRVAKLLFGLFANMEARHTGKIDHTALGALEQLLALTPTAKNAILAYCSLLERAGDYDCAAKLAPIAETAQQHSQLARLYLGSRDWERALDHAHIALEMPEDDSQVQLSSVLTIGLAQYFSNDFDSALETFTTALDLTENSQAVVILLAQVLWETGKPEEQEVAAQQLFESIEAEGASTKISLVLGIIGLLNDDRDTLDAITEELRGISISECPASTDVSYVLSRLQGSQEPLRRSLAADPTQFEVWKHVDPQMSLLVAGSSGASPLQISEANVLAGSVEHARRAIFYSPSNRDAWQSLALCAADGAIA